MGPTIYSRIKPPDGNTPMIHTKYEVKLVEHNSSIEQCVLSFQFSFKIYSRIKPPDGNTPMIHTKYEVKLVEHNSSIEQCVLAFQFSFN